MEELHIAYQKQGVLRFLTNVKGFDYSEAYGYVENWDIETLRYRFNIPDEDINHFWYMAISR